MRWALLAFALLLGGMFATSLAHADILPSNPGDTAVAECFGKDIAETCVAEDGTEGTCVIIRGGPIGRPWDRVACLSAAEAERGRADGWVVGRTSVRAVTWEWIVPTVTAFFGLMWVVWLVATRARSRVAAPSTNT
jgi:hypothetical protein